MTHRQGALAPSLSLALALTLVPFAPAGCSAPDPGVYDDEAAGEISGGKADGSYGLSACQQRELLAFLNSCAADNSALSKKPTHLYWHARRKFLAKRDGPNGICGDDDGFEFKKLEDVDRVRWIGTKTIRRLGAAFTKACENAAIAEVIFSPQPYDKSHLPRIVALIDGAKHHVDVAMYSFRDSKITEALKRALARNVKVRFIYQKAQAERKDPAGTTSSKLEDLGINVRYVTASKVMHHKFVIVDGPVDDVAAAKTATLATGSGNWTSSAATQFDENTIVLRGAPAMVLAFQHEFNTLWRKSLDFVWKSGLPFEQGITLDPTTFPDTPDARALFTSSNFDTSTTSFRRVRPRYTVADAIVAEIAKARRSIYVASGHLRSWRIYEAIVAAKKAHPALDVRLYLDGQEFVSAGYSAYLDRRMAKCVVAANTATQVADCRDAGQYYSYKATAVDTDGDGVGGDIQVRFKYYAYRWDYHYAPQMHHKVLIIDGETLIAGSYNLSHNAEIKSFENMMVLRAPRFAPLIKRFTDNFKAIWDTDPDGKRLDALIDDIKTGSTIPLVFPSMALDHEQVTALKALIVENCPAVDNDPDYKRNPHHHTRCPRR